MRDSYLITKCDKILLQNVSGFLSQNGTVVLQIATVTIKCDVYYKMCRCKVQLPLNFRKCLNFQVIF